MQESHRRRNITIAAIIAIVALILAVFISQSGNQTIPIQSSVVYDMDTLPQLYPDGNTKTINLSCSIGYGKESQFYLVLTLNNASFSNQTEQPYNQVNNTNVEFPFFLQSSNTSMSSSTKTAFFTINENVTGFSFYLYFGKYDQKPIPALWDWCTCSLVYKWNETANCYDLSQKGQIIS